MFDTATLAIEAPETDNRKRSLSGHRVEKKV